MGFYESIAEYYDEIFPLDPATLAFTEGAADKASPRRLLDLGCATGSLVEALSGRFDEVAGLDLSEELIRQGRASRNRQGEDPASGISYHVGSMLDCRDLWPADYFSAISCFGNSLAHLADEEEVLLFLNRVRPLLKVEAPLLLQIINYDRVVDHGLSGLPNLETESLRFERRYSPAREDGRIDFHTRLSLKAEGIALDNSVPLLPIRAANLHALLERAGFSRISLFGSFEPSPWDRDSFITIAEARR